MCGCVQDNKTNKKTKECVCVGTRRGSIFPMECGYDMYSKKVRAGKRGGAKTSGGPINYDVAYGEGECGGQARAGRRDPRSAARRESKQRVSYSK